MSKEEYIEFMYNPKNQKNCDECPENSNFKGVNQLPCGQYHCWVTCHVQQANRGYVK